MFKICFKQSSNLEYKLHFYIMFIDFNSERRKKDQLMLIAKYLIENLTHSSNTWQK